MENTIRGMSDVELDRNMKRALRKSVNQRVNVDQVLDMLLEEYKRREQPRVNKRSKVKRFFERCIRRVGE